MKADTTTIDGYNEMSVEEKLAALEGFEFEDNAGEIERLKSAISKANKEAADWKKKHNELLSEDERQRTAAAEEVEQMKRELDELKKEKAMSQYKAKSLALGMDDAISDAVAKALADGDTDGLFKQLTKFIKLHDEQREVDALKDTPRPEGGGSSNALTREEILKIDDPIERQKRIGENIHLFQ